MKFSNVCEVAGREGLHYIVRTGKRNVRVLECGHQREESFVIPMNQVLNRRPAGAIPLPAEPDFIELPEVEDLEYLPQ